MMIDRLRALFYYMGDGAWPFLVGEVICLVNSANERDISLLNYGANKSSLAKIY